MISTLLFRFAVSRNPITVKFFSDELLYMLCRNKDCLKLNRTESGGGLSLNIPAVDEAKQRYSQCHV